MNLRSSRGQAFLALVFLIGGIVVMVGILIAFVASSFVDTGYGLAASANAEAAATAGAQDGLLQLDRNPTFFNTTGYSVSNGTTTATVTVTQNSPITGEITVLSTATVSSRTRKINVVLSENASTTQINIVSWQEIQ